jgi:hypothetical protein
MKIWLVSKFDWLLILFLVAMLLVLVLSWFREVNDFRGVINLDKNREFANHWLSQGRSREEVLKKFGYPHNRTEDTVWVWLFDEPIPSTESRKFVDQIEYRRDGLWIQFSGQIASGPVRSISGNWEDYKIAVPQIEEQSLTE